MKIETFFRLSLKSEYYKGDFFSFVKSEIDDVNSQLCGIDCLIKNSKAKKDRYNYVIKTEYGFDYNVKIEDEEITKMIDNYLVEQKKELLELKNILFTDNEKMFFERLNEIQPPVEAL